MSFVRFFCVLKLRLVTFVIPTLGAKNRNFTFTFSADNSTILQFTSIDAELLSLHYIQNPLESAWERFVKSFSGKIGRAVVHITGGLL